MRVEEDSISVTTISVLYLNVSKFIRTDDKENVERRRRDIATEGCIKGAVSFTTEDSTPESKTFTTLSIKVDQITLLSSVYLAVTARWNVVKGCNSGGNSIDLPSTVVVCVSDCACKISLC